MQIYPAIDLCGGHCVRLYQGKFDQVTSYGNDPAAMTKQFVAEGATWLHVVDLDAAKNPAHSQFELIASLAAEFNLNIQTGGGIRQEQQVENLLNAGMSRVVVGSKAVKDPAEVKRWLQKFGAERLVLALDIQPIENEAFIAVHGWQEVSQKKLTDLLDYFLEANLLHVLCTDITRDGTLKGPNLSLYRKILDSYPGLQLQASGGIGSLADIQALHDLSMPGAILGRALYEKKFTLHEALTINHENTKV